MRVVIDTSSKPWPVEVNGQKFSLKSNGNFLYVVVDSEGPGEVFGKLTIRVVNERTGRSVQSSSNTTFSRGNWRPCNFPRGTKLSELKVDDKLVVYFNFAGRQKTASSVIAPVAGKKFPTLGSGYKPIVRVVRPNREVYGYIGLKNMSANCYLNSILQLLFHVPALRRLVFFVEAPNEPPSKNVLLNLQALFYQMQTAPNYADAHPLMRSFGWTSDEMYRQNDASEMMTVLLDNLMTKIPGERLKQLFMFKTRTHMEHPESGLHNQQDSDTTVLCLPVEGCHTLQEAINLYGEREPVPDYKVEGYQSVLTLRHEIVTGPEILLIQLNRYTIDPQTYQGVKLSAPIDFPEMLEVPTTAGPMYYNLHGVCVHQGGCGGGHYWACVKPTMEDKWFQFNDATVHSYSIESLKRDAIRDGYMFLYARQDTEVDCYFEVTEEDVPERVVEASKYTDQDIVDISVVTETGLLANTANAITSFRNRENELSFAAGTSETIESLYKYVSELMEGGSPNFRLWKCTHEGRPIECLSKESTAKVAGLGRSPVLFLEDGTIGNVGGGSLVFIKEFTGTAVVLKDMVIAPKSDERVLKIFQDRHEISPDRANLFRFYIERENNTAEEISPDMKMNELSSGMTLVFQSRDVAVDTSDVQGMNYADQETVDKFSYCMFLEYKHRYVRGTVANFSEELFECAFPDKLTITELKRFLADGTGITWNPTTSSMIIYYTSCGSYQTVGINGESQQPMSSSGKPTIIVQSFENISEEQMSHLRPVLVQLSEDRIHISKTFCMPVNPEDTVRGVIQRIDELQVYPAKRVSVQSWVRLRPPLEDLDVQISKVEPVLRVDVLDPAAPSVPIVPVSIEAPEGQVARCFFLELKPDEVFKDTKARISAVFEIGSEMRFRVVYRNSSRPTTDHTKLFDEANEISGIEVYKDRPSQYSGAIVIRN